MAETKHNEAATEQPRELVVVIHRMLSFWEYEGTRAQLEAENLIPPQTEWPEGSNSVRWDAGRFRWWLRRTRPAGLKGPMRLWTSGNWWRLRCELVNGPSYVQQCILQKQREVAAMLHRESAAGMREWYAYVDRCWRAAEDDAFQKFKASVPGLVPPPRRARKPKATASTGPA